MLALINHRNSYQNLYINEYARENTSFLVTCRRNYVLNNNKICTCHFTGIIPDSTDLLITLFREQRGKGF